MNFPSKGDWCSTSKDPEAENPIQSTEIGYASTGWMIRQRTGRILGDRFSNWVKVKIQRAVIHFQNYLSGLPCSVFSSLNSSENFIEESPLKALFQGINEQIATLWIKNHQFEFVCPKSENSHTLSFFSELASYRNHCTQISIHQNNSFLETEGFSRIPLTFWDNELVGYFSFSEKENICLLSMEEMQKVADSVTNTIQVFLILLETKEQALLDPLTNIPNRRAVQERASTLISTAIRDGSYISVFMIDLDFFKKINDEHWHPVGDEVLKAVSWALQGVLRPGDVLGRYGWEEFMVVCKHRDMWDSMIVDERLLSAVRSVQVKSVQWLIHPTCSIWVHTKKPVGGDITSILLRYTTSSDIALYQAKETGRNRTVHFPDKSIDTILWADCNINISCLQKAPQAETPAKK